MKPLVDFLINLPERLGWVFLWSGWAKLNDLPTVIENFIDWGIPFPHILTPFVSVVEFLVGLLLLLGLLTRLAAVPLIIVMIVAIIAAKWTEVDSLETLLGFDEVAYMVIFLWLAVAGPGPISLDRVLQRSCSHPTKREGRPQAFNPPAEAT